MNPLKELGECLISDGDDDYFFRPSFINMTRIGEPAEIVQTFYDLHHDEVSKVIESAIDAYGFVPEWLVQHIKTTNYGRKAIMAAMDVIAACCDSDTSILTGEIRKAKTAGKSFKLRRGAMPEFDMLVIARSLITHGIIGKAKVRQLQRNQSTEYSNEFRASDYIISAMKHFGITREVASNLTMTEFALLLAAKYPEQKGLTKDEYDTLADDYLKKKKAKLAAATQQ
ncbi:DUF6246 family protein [Buttiauxella gaviniae]|uniref:DUF6246 family protein n=1 Tax=Buttiauxella gaviniae TaxID=82990 RepID=UPI003C76263D